MINAIIITVIMLFIVYYVLIHILMPEDRFISKEEYDKKKLEKLK